MSSLFPCLDSGPSKSRDCVNSNMNIWEMFEVGTWITSIFQILLGQRPCEPTTHEGVWNAEEEWLEVTVPYACDCVKKIYGIGRMSENVLNEAGQCDSSSKKPEREQMWHILSVSLVSSKFVPVRKD